MSFHVFVVWLGIYVFDMIFSHSFVANDFHIFAIECGVFTLLFDVVWCRECQMEADSALTTQLLHGGIFASGVVSLLHHTRWCESDASPK